MKYSALIFSLLVTGVLQAQDTLRKREVNITSTFKPTLKEAAKININAAPPTADTSRPRLQYNIPNQNLQLTFQPGVLKPLALQIDSVGKWGNESYVKGGFGSFQTPYLQAGFSVGDGKNAGLNLYGKHYSSRGNIKYQDVGHTNIDLHGFFQSGNNMEWNVRLGGVQEKYNRYGFEPKNLVVPEDSLRIKLQTFRGRVSMNNIQATELGISYAPEFRFETFTDGASNKEFNTFFRLPLRKTLGNQFEVEAALDWMMNQYRPNAKAGVNNNWVSAAAAVAYQTGPLNVHAGLKPTWDNGTFRLLPDMFAEFNTNNQLFSVQVGWVANLRASGFQYLTSFNPFVLSPATVANTRIEERYAGIKGSSGDHLSYSAKVALNRLFNQPLFVNDSTSGKAFDVLIEPDMTAFNFGGSLGYTVGEQFSVISNLAINTYRTKTAKHAWGLIPLEWNTTLKLQVLKDLYATSTLYVFQGPWSRSKSKGEFALPGSTDLSAGLEFRLVKNVRLWAQFNNLFNNTYQRWNQYPTYGFNFLGGVVFSFAQKK